MSEYQKEKITVKCPMCERTRMICVGHLEKIRREGATCRQCSGKKRQGIPMSEIARKKMSDSKKQLLAQGWLPTFTREHKGTFTYKTIVCPNCEKLFERLAFSKQVCCSKECANRLRVANGTHHFYKGGITPINFSIRTSTRYKEWKQKVIERDGFNCQLCSANSRPHAFILMHVDHIRPLAVLIRENNIKTIQEARECDELFRVENGRVLCVDCHQKTDTFLTGTFKYLKELAVNE